MRSLHKVVLGVAVASTALTTACGPAPRAPGSENDDVRITTTSSPFAQVTAGAVSGSVPDGWGAVRATSRTDGVRRGFVASPRSQAHHRIDGSTSGLAATWVDATRVGVPSDYFYLAARGSLNARLAGSARCRTMGHRVLLDRSHGSGHGGLAGDYMARAWGRCGAGNEATRWSFFVAAPGFGPVRTMGIPASGLYVVTAAVKDGGDARTTLGRMVGKTRFGDASVSDLLGAARQTARATL
jgi:hypothetical protein